MGQVEARHPEPEIASSNAIRLSGREWLIVAAFALALFVLTPVCWQRVERLEPQPDYRIPYDLSNDYWLFTRCADAAVAANDAVLIGDSVIWGQYVTREQTLSHYLNELAGRQRFANLGVDGAHPVALAGLLEHYAAGICGKDVVVHCNPLWMSSDKHDLRAKEEFRFNHPQLVPQFVPSIPCYKEEVSRRLGVVVSRNLPFNGWTSHLQLTYYDKMDIPSWTLEHPYDTPLKPLTFQLPPSDNKLRHEPIPWSRRPDARPLDFPWVSTDSSLQWRSFQRTLEVLTQRGNRVFVLVGPFNEHMLTANSREGYTRVRRAIEDWLRANSIPCLVPTALPSELYADASHPLSEGYRLLAKQLFDGHFGNKQ